MGWVAVLMGSKSDWPVMQSCTQVLGDLGIKYEVKVTSAHRTPAETAEFVADATARDCSVFICAAGLAAHLGGVVAAHTVRPVIGVPMESGGMGGMDALLSTVQMPGGIPVATVAVGKAGAKNAGYLAGQMMSLADASLVDTLQADRQKNREGVAQQNADVQADLAKSG